MAISTVTENIQAGDACCVQSSVIVTLITYRRETGVGEAYSTIVSGPTRLLRDTENSMCTHFSATGLTDMHNKLLLRYELLSLLLAPETVCASTLLPGLASKLSELNLSCHPS